MNRPGGSVACTRVKCIRCAVLHCCRCSGKSINHNIDALVARTLRAASCCWLPYCISEVLRVPRETGAPTPATCCVLFLISALSVCPDCVVLAATGKSRKAARPYSSRKADVSILLLTGGDRFSGYLFLGLRETVFCCVGFKTDAA